MGVEYLLYFYGAVCLSMIVFNVAYSILLRRNDVHLDQRIQGFQAAIQRQLRRLERGEKVEEAYLRRLQRKLRHVNNLIPFERALRTLSQDGEDVCAQEYMAQLQPCLLYLAIVYQKKENTQAAYFSYFLSRYMKKVHLPIQTMQEILLDYIAKENLYCRVNALQALYAFGSVEHILTALHIQDAGSVRLHEKILTEGLLSFTGEHESLIEKLWDQFDSFSPHTQLAILNYIRFQSGEYGSEMFALMLDEGADKELRISAIRYFGRYPHPTALEPLLAFTENNDPTQWEFATVAASSLAHYPQPRVMEALKRALHSGNWYVRYAASASLEALDVRYEDMIDIVAGNDRYAREMMTYRLESRRIQKASV